jgi:predicted ATPase
MSKVKTITVSNLKAISNLTADFNGCTAIITGGNNKGKSSFLRSLPDRLKQTKPDVILKEGETEGFAEWELTTGEKFRWQFDNKTKAGEKLIFITKENIKTSITKEISERYFPKGFDIDKFLNEGPQKQREMLQKIVGIDFTDVDRRYKEAYENRTFANKQLESDRAKLKPVNKNLEKEPKPFIELQKQLAGIDSHNEKYKYVTDAITEKENKVIVSENEILRLRDLITIEEDKIKSLEAKITKGKAWIEVKENQPKTEEEAQKLQDQIDDIIKGNEAIEENNKALEIKEQFDISEKEAKAADDLVKKIEAEKVDMIKKAKLPVGFGFSDDGVTYLGHSLSKAQLSTSAIYIAALKLAALNIGEVKTLHFDASYLDKNSLQEIENWAKENDLQLLIERPDFDGGEIEFHLIDAVS